MFKLQSKDGAKNVWLVDPVMKFGSSRNNEIYLRGDGIAALHGKVYVYEGVIHIEPISDAEIHVNEHIISLKTKIKLGDIIRIGLFEFAVTNPSISKDDPFFGNKAEEIRVASTKATIFRASVAKTPAATAIGKGSGWMLQCMNKDLKDKRYPVDNAVILGRSKKCDLSFSYDRLSRKHAEFKLLYGVLFVNDLGSLNGVYHNGQRVEKAKLTSGDTVAFDKLEFIVIGPKDSGEVEDVINETIVRSAITPEMLKADKLQARGQNKDGKKSAVANPRVKEQKKSDNSLMFIIFGLLIAATIVGDAVIFL